MTNKNVKQFQGFFRFIIYSNKMELKKTNTVGPFLSFASSLRIIKYNIFKNLNFYFNYATYKKKNKVPTLLPSYVYVHNVHSNELKGNVSGYLFLCGTHLNIRKLPSIRKLPTFHRTNETSTTKFFLKDNRCYVCQPF